MFNTAYVKHVEILGTEKTEFVGVTLLFIFKGQH